MTCVLPPTNGCGLVALPFALVGAVLSIVSIPVNMALGLVGPATNAAATAAPYALLLVQKDGDAKPGLAVNSESTANGKNMQTARAGGLDILEGVAQSEKRAWDLVLLRPQKNVSREEFRGRAEMIARGAGVLSAYYFSRAVPAAEGQTGRLAQKLEEQGVRCYLAEI